MRKIKVVFYSIFFMLAVGVAGTTTAGQICTQENILERINVYRVKQNLPPLQVNAQIAQAAKTHSREMAEKIIPFGHDGFTQRIHGLFKLFPTANGGAENVLYSDVDDAQTVVQAWLHSRGHRKNIEGNFNLTGIGVAHDGNGRVYVTEIFIRTNGKQRRLHPVIF
jgi:uncharacterized protein YkwD